MNENKSVLAEKSFDGALSIIKLYKSLINDKREFIMSRQLLRSGTSIGANVRESRNAESKRDFIHKLSIAQKESDETIYWLELLCKSEYITQEEFLENKTRIDEILKILKSSVLTAKKSLH